MIGVFRHLCLDDTFHVGKYSGKTVREILTEDPNYGNWMDAMDTRLKFGWKLDGMARVFMMEQEGWKAPKFDARP